MIRVALEAVITIAVLLLARAIITSIIQSFASTTFGSKPQPQSSNRPESDESARTSGTLHRDPVCGIFVAETTPFRRDVAGSTFYYCSKACRESHSLVSHT
jgi:YHS domain-containing protein